MNDGSPLMFSRIVRDYDRMNRLMSLGMDRAWRERAAADCEGLVLDLCCGTGDMAIASKKRGLSVIGLDGNMAMLRAARRKSPGLPLVLADAQCLPFKDSSFDSATIAWGIRNIPERNLALREAIRILRPGGKLVVLDSVLPGNPFVRFLFRLYAVIWIPILARLIRADLPAYRYFVGSVERFGQKINFLGEMKAAGFERAQALDLSFGLVAMFTGNTGETP